MGKIVGNISPAGEKRSDLLLRVGIFLIVLMLLVNIPLPRYEGSKRSYVFHRPACEAVKTIEKENLVYFKDKRSALLDNYRPCKICQP